MYCGKCDTILNEREGGYFPCVEIFLTVWIFTFTESLDEMRAELDRLLDELNEAIVKALCSENLAYLQQVNNIPRLFRRTNREAPTKALPYVTSLLEGPNAFFQSHQHHPKARFWLQTMFSRLTKQ